MSIPGLSQVWRADSVIDLYEVAWDSHYNNCVYFDNATDRDAYFNTARGTQYTFTWGNLSYVRPGDPITVDLQYDDAVTFNYMRVQNPDFETENGVVNRPYFYFITDVEYLAPHSSRYTLQLDVWQTYIYDMVFGQSLLVQGHLPIANSNCSPTKVGSFQRYLSVPEQLDVGDKLLVTQQEFHPLFDDASESKIVVMSTVSLTDDPGDLNAPSQRTTGYTSQVDGLPTACASYCFGPDSFMQLVNGIAAYPWISRNFLSITVAPADNINMSTSATTHSKFGSVPFNYMLDFKPEQFQLQTIYSPFQNYLGQYSFLYKLMCYPFCALEIMGDGGNSVLLKPQYFRSNNPTVTQWGVIGQPHTRIGYSLHDYGSTEAAASLAFNGHYSYSDDGETTDNTVYIDGMPQVPILNDNYVTTMADTAYTRAYNYQSAGWAYDKAYSSYANAVANSNDTATNSRFNLNSQNSLMWGQRNIQAIQNGGNAIMSLLSGNIGGALGGVVGGVGAYESSQLAQDAMNYQTNNNIDTQQGINNRNNELAYKVANGDYAMAAKAITAQVQQAEITPPSRVGSQSGDAINWAYGMMGLRVRWRVLNQGAMRAAANYFMRWGYACNEWIVPLANPKCMSKFTYWKYNQFNLKPGIGPEAVRLAIRGIFESGVTVWGDPADIGNVKLEQNIPFSGIAY